MKGKATKAKRVPKTFEEAADDTIRENKNVFRRLAKL
jgi:hypothetical protein